MTHTALLALLLQQSAWSRHTVNTLPPAAGNTDLPGLSLLSQEEDRGQGQKRTQRNNGQKLPKFHRRQTYRFKKIIKHQAASIQRNPPSHLIQTEGKHLLAGREKTPLGGTVRRQWCQRQKTPGAASSEGGSGTAGMFAAASQGAYVTTSQDSTAPDSPTQLQVDPA